MVARFMSAFRAVPEEDLLRAQYYGLLAELLAQPPETALLRTACRFRGDDETDLGRALGKLAQQAAALPRAAVEQEYALLFGGLGRGEVVPYGSFYLSGFLSERPRVELRSDMADLGIGRAELLREPEDHVASLCDVMAGMITGAFGEPAALFEQHRFFLTHLQPWMPRFFRDLEAAEAAVFYRPVGTIGRLFFDIEAHAFDMEG